jgi:hypothetical protein
MFRLALRFACCLLALGLVGAAVPARGPVNGREAAEKLAADLAAGKKVSEADARGFAQKWKDLEEVMSVLKPPKGRPTTERILSELSEKTTFSAQEKKTLARIAGLARALALVAPFYGARTKGDLTRKRDWDQAIKDMGEGANGVLQALEKGDGRSASRAATRLAASCANCHGVFR